MTRDLISGLAGLLGLVLLVPLAVYMPWVVVVGAMLYWLGRPAARRLPAKRSNA